MSFERQEYLRAAARIHERLTNQRTTCRPIELPAQSWLRCRRMVKLVQRVCQKGWPAATAHTQRTLSYELQTLRGELDEVLRELQSRSKPFVAGQRHIFEDLLAVEDEFDDVEVDLKQRRISATTEAIVLERMYLGPFRIELDWERIGLTNAYRVVATDPQEAASSSDITHPHVNGDRLCEGEANLPIREALKQGRLFDFFTIVRQTLQTYNAGSAYVQLDSWNGVRCADCGWQIPDNDDQYSCPQCHDFVCNECVSGCAGCDTDHCNQCTENCSGCGESNCRTCLSACNECDQRFCQECLDDGQCNNCRESENNQPVPEAEPCAAVVAAGPESAVAAVHADRVGETTSRPRRRRH